MTNRNTSLRTARIQELLHLCPDLQEIQPEEAAFLKSKAILEYHESGSRLWANGEAPTSVFIPSGAVRIAVLDENGKISPAAFVLNNHLIGEAEVFANWPQRFNDAIAMTAQDVLRIPAEEFVRCVYSSPALTRFWLKQSNTRFILTSLHRSVLSRRSAEERMFYMMKILLPFMSAMSDGTTILPFSQEDIGGLAGLTRPAASKVIVAWRKIGLIEIGYQYINVLKPDYFLK